MQSLLDALVAVVVGGLIILTVLSALINIQEHAFNTNMQITMNNISEFVSSCLQEYFSYVSLDVDPTSAIIHAKKKSFKYWGEYQGSVQQFDIEQGTQDPTTGWWPLSVKIGGATIMGDFYTEEEFLYTFYDEDGNQIPFSGGTIPGADLENIRSMRIELAFVHPGWEYGGATTTIRNRIVFWKYFKNMYLDV